MTLLTILTFVFFITTCIKFAVIIKLNQLLDINDKEIFFLVNERDTLREKILKLQRENEDLNEAILILTKKPNKVKKEQKKKRES